MNAQTVLRTNGAKANDLLESLGDTAGALAKTIEVTAVPLVAIVGDTASAFAKSVEERAAPFAKNLEESMGMLAEAVESTVEALAEGFEQKSEQAREEVAASVKSFRFGRREGLILGAAVGMIAAVWLIRRMDRKAAAEKLRAAGARVSETTQALSGRVGEATQELTGRVGEATHGLADKAGTLSDKAGALTGLASERVGQVVQQVRGQSNGTVEGTKLRISEATSPVQEIEIDQAPQGQAAGSDPDKDTQAAINEAVEEVERAQEETLEEARNLGLSNGMKVVAFDGTNIGRVQEVREDVFVLDRPKGSDLLVPLTELARIEGTVAYLRVEADRVSKMGWEKADKS